MLDVIMIMKFWFLQKIFANGAELGTEIVATNGVVHIIDTLLHEGAVRETALSYMEDAGNRAIPPTTK